MTTLPDVHRAHREDFERFVLAQAAPWHREHLTALYAAWHTYNTSYFAGAMTPPYLLLAEPKTPRFYGDTSPATGFGAKLQIRIRPSLVQGTHPHLLHGSQAPAGRQRFVDDILLHETIHQYQMEILGVYEASYDWHGPTFRDNANRIGTVLGLPPVRVSKVPKKEWGTPSCAQWPYNVRPADYYQGAVCHVWKLPPLPEEKLYAELARLTRTCDRAMLERLCTRLLASKKADNDPQLVLPPPASRHAQIPLSDQEAQILHAIAQTEGGLTPKDAGEVLGENQLLAGKVLKTLEGLRLVTKQGRHYILRQKDAL